MDWTTYTPPPNRLADTDMTDAIYKAGVRLLLSLKPHQQHRALGAVLDESDVRAAMRHLKKHGEKLARW